MTLSDKDRKILWALSGNECSMEGCGEELIRPSSPEDGKALERSGIVLGEEAHIRSKKTDGPRHDPNYPLHQLDTYQNLILLCRKHHKIIDDQNGREYSVDLLEAMKRQHEKSKVATGKVDRELLLITASQLDTWTALMGLDDWEHETSSLLAYSTPHLVSDSFLSRLDEIGDWLLRSEWPVEYPLTRSAFQALGRAVWRLSELASKYLTRSDTYPGFHELPRGHKNIPWDESLYIAKLREFHTQRVQLQWAVYHVTCASNHVIASVRQEFDRFYRYTPGYQLIVLDYGFNRITLKPQCSFDVKCNPSDVLQAIERAYAAGDPRDVDLELVDLIHDPA